MTTVANLILAYMTKHSCVQIDTTSIEKQL